MQVFTYASMIMLVYKYASKQWIKNLLLQKLVCFVRYFRIPHKKWKLTVISRTVTFSICPQMIAICMLLVICDFLHMLLAFWIFLSKTCYYLQKLVSFRSCCTSRNFFPRCCSWGEICETKWPFWRIFCIVID